MTTTALPDDKQLQELEEKFDPEMRFRPLGQAATNALLMKLRMVMRTTKSRSQQS